MNKILVVNTGGTIASISSSKGILLEDNNMLENIFKNYSDINFECVSPFYIHSENLNNTHLKILYDYFSNINYNEYIGIIITHGSDTLAFSAAFIGLICQNTTIPVVLTASNYPMDNVLSNGKINLTSSIEFIKNSNETNVFVIYKDIDVNVYLANNFTSASSIDDKFSTTNVVIYGKMIDNKFCKTSKTIFSSINNSPKIVNNFENQIAVITVYPNLDYDNYNFKNNVKAVLHTTYHSGTASTLSCNNSVIDFIEKCTEKNIDFYFLSQKKTDEFLYTSKNEMLNTKAKFLLSISFEAALMKLTIAYNQTSMSICEFMKSELKENKHNEKAL